MACALPGKFDMSALMRQLECPICLESCSAPIVQCLNGHNLCSTCRTKLTKCPVCRAKISVVRNIFAEQMAEVEYPCNNADKGCQEKIMLKNMDAHLKQCKSDRTKCLLSVPNRGAEGPYYVPCEWTGKVDELLVHAEKVHSDSVSFDATTDTWYKIRKSHLLLIAVHDHLFWSFLNYDSTRYDMRGAVFSVTDIKLGEEFTFKYVFESPNGQLRISKEGTVCRQGHSDETYNSTIFQGNRMMEQLSTSRKLSFTVKISKKVEMP